MRERASLKCGLLGPSSWRTSFLKLPCGVTTREERLTYTNRQISGTYGGQDDWTMVQVEQRWRVRPNANEVPAKAPSDAVVTSWATPPQVSSFECSVEGSDVSATLTYLRSQAASEFWVAGRRVLDGCVAPQNLVVENSAQRRRSVARGATSMFRVYLPQSLLRESYEHAKGRPPDTEIVLSDFAVLTDTAVERLVQALVYANNHDAEFGRVYLDGVGLAIASRLIAMHLHPRGNSGAGGVLAKWRLKRVCDYVDASLGGPISLHDLANAAGLTRMHFAAQFQARTGFSPHQYTLRRRVARTQDLLLNPELSIARVALDVGFQTQAHFTVVFKKIVGETPNRWRQQLS
jgi:AraC family transcriptional regulator